VRITAREKTRDVTCRTSEKHRCLGYIHIKSTINKRRNDEMENGLNKWVVNESLTRMVLAEEMISIPTRCRVVKTDTEQFYDSVGSGKDKKEVPKQSTNQETECLLTQIDKKEYEDRIRAVKKQKKQLDSVGASADGDWIRIRRDVFDKMMNKSHPEYKDIQETEKQSPEERRNKEKQKEKTRKKKERQDLIQRRKKNWISGALEEQEQPKKKRITIRIQKKSDVDEAKSKKKNCSDFPSGKKSGANPFHDPETGRLTSREKAGSWSLRNATGAGCKRGQAKVKGGRELFTKIKCGRGEKHRCSDGSEKWE
jgi:hypothetical protein